MQTMMVTASLYNSPISILLSLAVAQISLPEGGSAFYPSDPLKGPGLVILALVETPNNLGCGNKMLPRSCHGRQTQLQRMVHSSSVFSPNV